MARYGLRGFLLDCKSPAAGLARLNALLFRILIFEDRHLFLGILDPGAGVITYCTGGMFFRWHSGKAAARHSS